MAISAEWRRQFDGMPVTLVALGLGFGLFVNGAVPLLAMPTLGQAVWLTGFSQSFINESLFTIYAHNIGAPEPAAIAFGLAGAWPAGIFIAAGLHPGDAYSATVAMWLISAFFAAYGICLRLAVPPAQAVLGAVVWLCLPVVWGHADYSMVAVGIALLPLYFLAAIQLFCPLTEPRHGQIRASIVYAIVCLIAIFMDGYSFMMFASGSSVFGLWLLLSCPERRRDLLIVRFPLHAACFALAYIAYISYLGKSGFSPASLDFFRGWGVDLMYLAVPTQGVHWIPDQLGLSLERTQELHFGDASVWRTTFLLPLIGGAIIALFRLDRDRPLVRGMALVGILGFYMALGPSLKINSTKSESDDIGPLMPSEYAVAATGSGFFSEHLPGFNNMRASYRWSALGSLGAWVLIVTLMSAGDRRRRIAGTAAIVGIALVSLPNVSESWRSDTGHRRSLFAMEEELLPDIGRSVTAGARCAFLPWRNDFLVNYVSSKLDIESYNIGGDKNFLEARSHWPPTMSQFPMGRVDSGFKERVVALLRRGEADVVIMPYLDMLWAAHLWPYPNQYELQMRSIAASLRGYADIEVRERQYHAAVYRADQGDDSRSIMSSRMDICVPPECLRRTNFADGALTKVGKVVEGSLTNSGREGFVHYGPYVGMEAGDYRFVLYGEAEHLTGGTWIDIASRQGTVRHAVFNIGEDVAPDDRRLVDDIVWLVNHVEELEVRVYAGPGSELRVDGYQLVPVGDPTSTD